MSAKMRTEYADKNADKTALKETKAQTIRKNIYNFLICKNFLNARTCAMEKEQKNKKCQFHLHQVNKKFTNEEKYHQKYIAVFFCFAYLCPCLPGLGQ